MTNMSSSSARSQVFQRVTPSGFCQNFSSAAMRAAESVAGAAPRPALPRKRGWDRARASDGSGARGRMHQRCRSIWSLRVSMTRRRRSKASAKPRSSAKPIGS
jgi:hypothetical protein